MNCADQCHGCAYKAGSAANQEGQNYLRGIFAALGGYPFVCHEALGWTPDREGYPAGTKSDLVMLLDAKTSNAIMAIVTDPETVELPVSAMRERFRTCGGWKAAIKRLRDAGWFSDPDVRLVRRQFAKHAAACLERLTRDPEALMPDDRREKGKDVEDIEEAIRWFFNEAQEAGIRIGWLFQGGPRS